ncbi:hypothetical protein GGE68_003327 [Rhizobium leguminosarum]|nr:hypothetical protein [Rhizobium leguminosarum]
MLRFQLSLFCIAITRVQTLFLRFLDVFRFPSVHLSLKTR